MARKAKPLVAIFALAATVLLWMSGGCGSNKSNGDLADDSSSSSSSGGSDTFDPDASNSSSGTGFGGVGGSSGFQGGDDGGGTPACPAGSPLSCYVNMNCGGGAETTLSGKVYDPAGKNPIENVVVFVPNDVTTLPKITPGTNTCSSCDTPVGDYVTATITDSTGAFTLKNVPTGKNLPVVIQIGKWRRIMTVPQIADCKTTQAATSGTNQFRLPANKTEGDLPQMALLTGGLDDLGCFLTKVGISASEYSAPNGGGHLSIYQGLSLGGTPAPGLSSGTAGNCTNTSCPLWASKTALESYDIVFLACEGDTFDPDDNGGTGDAGPGLGGLLGGGASNVTKAGKQALHDWLDEGGKVFATHFHYTWFKNGPADFQGVANWLGYSLGTGTCNNCTIDTQLQSGKDFLAWLQSTGAVTGNGISLTGVADSVSTINTATTSRWIYGNSGTGGAMDTKYLSFETPIGGIPVDAGEVGGKKYCGKAVFTDLHAGGAPSGAVPSACKAGNMTAQEKALEFLIFNLASCVADESMPMKVPPPPPK